MFEEKSKELIKKYMVTTTEEEVRAELEEEFYSYIFDETLDGLVMELNGIKESKLEEYFAYNFGYYSGSGIYKTESGYYIVFEL